MIAAALLATSLYPIPSPLPMAAPGTVISSHAFTGGAALRNAASNTFVLYHTRSLRGTDVAVSGTIAIPRGSPPPHGWPIISWAHGTTGNAPQCAPSNQASENVEQRLLDSFVAAGYAVMQTDYEGEGTPGIHPYFASIAASRDVTDIVRAARSLDSTLGNRWVVMGHSEGGTAAIFTAAVAPAWAPDLHLLGAVAYAPPVDLIDTLRFAVSSQTGSPALVIDLMMVEGIASTDPAIDLNDMLTERGRGMAAQLQSACADDLAESLEWKATAPASLFHIPDATLDRLMHDFAINQPLNVNIRVPLLLEQGSDDTTVPASGTEALHANFVSNHLPAELDVVNHASHDSILQASAAHVLSWIGSLFKTST